MRDQPMTVLPAVITVRSFAGHAAAVSHEQIGRKVVRDRDDAVPSRPPGRVMRPARSSSHGRGGSGPPASVWSAGQGEGVVRILRQGACGHG